jgi:hypothetical protein
MIVMSNKKVVAQTKGKGENKIHVLLSKYLLESKMFNFSLKGGSSK